MADVLILYATETGNAQDSADYLARRCRTIRLQSAVSSIDRYPLPNLISEALVVFVVSTTGSGVEPRTMSAFWQTLLRSDLPEDIFDGLPFAVFGLGDSAYEKFCWTAKKLSRRMRALGASEVYSRGEGDEQHPLGTEAGLEKWTDGLLETLVRVHSPPASLHVSLAEALPPPRVTFTSTPGHDLRPETLPTFENGYAATVTDNKRITAQDWYQDVRHLELNFEHDIEYLPGDVAEIHPVASKADVEQLLGTMNWTHVADDPFFIETSLPDLPFVLTLRRLFSRIVDINAVPRRSFFQYLQHFTTDEQEKEKLQEFLSEEGADDLYEYCFKVRRTIQEVLADFRHVSIPRDYIFDVFPQMRPRQFSIASSVNKRPKTIQLCVAIVRYRTMLRVPRQGVCTSYLSRLRHGDVLHIRIKKGLITLPKDPEKPVICVGPGTGIAPMRAAIEERLHAGSTRNTLYFGCRHETKDQHYKDEWSAYAESQQIVYRVAFSRYGPISDGNVDGALPRARVYVQDLIQQDAKRIWELIGKEEAYVYISGSSNKMPAAVRGALVYAVETWGKYEAEEARRYVDRMVRDGRLVEECWS